jgi:photosystem II stability/assembly factor-like uncharacterized protein
MSAIALDPLIAEAKRRMRRRRLLLVAVAIAAGGSVIWATLPSGRPNAAGSGGSQSPAAHVPIYSFGATHFKSNGLMSAEGSSGLWLSANAGRTWLLVPPPESHGPHPWRRFFYNDFVDLSHGWAIGYSHDRLEIERTTDGGRTWRTSYLPGRWPNVAGFDGFRFRTRTEGSLGIIATKYQLERFRTKDGGVTWTHVPHASILMRRRHAVRAYVPGAPGPGDQIGALERTDDYGRHWTRVQLPGNPDIKELKSFGHLLVAIALVARPQWRFQLAIYASEDAGRHWTQRLAPLKIQPGGPQDACCFNVSAPAAGAVYAMSGSKLYVTHDAGRTWHGFRPLGLSPATGNEPIEFITARFGLSLHGSILVRTTDGGRHWAAAGPLKPRGHEHG